MKTRWVMLAVIALAAFGCKKGNKVNVVLNTSLTDCPSGTNCVYNFYNNADFTNWNNPVKGTSRIFWYTSTDGHLCSAATQLYFRTSQTNDDFDIDSAQIVAGNVAAYNYSCPCCENANYILFKPMGGEIKGHKSGDSWLINATIILGVESLPGRDTLKVNQYFRGANVPN